VGWKDWLKTTANMDRMWNEVAVTKFKALSPEILEIFTKEQWILDGQVENINRYL
jgi:hypothetical protein